MRPNAWPEHFPSLGAMSHMDSPGCGTCLVCTPVGSTCTSPVPSPLTILPPQGPANASGSSFIDPDFVAAAFSSVSSPQSAFVGMNAGGPGNGGPLPAFLVTSSAADFFLSSVPPLSMAGAVGFPGIPGPPPASFYAPASAMFASLPSLYSGLPSAFTAPVAMSSQGTPHAQSSSQSQVFEDSTTGFKTLHTLEKTTSSSYQHYGIAQDRSPSPAISSGICHAPLAPMEVVSPQREVSKVSTLSTGTTKVATSNALPLESNRCSTSGALHPQIANAGNSSSDIYNNNNNHICDLFDPQQGKDQPPVASRNDSNDDEGYVGC